MSGDLGGNKILGSTLGAFLGVLVLGNVAGGVIGDQYPAKPGYAIDVKEAAPAAGGGAAEAAKPIDWGVVLADAAKLPELVAKGEQLHKQCLSCHNFDSGGPNGTGPNLYGVVGRVSGTHPGFAYSDAMKAHAKPWSYDELGSFLTAPASYINGTKMGFAGLKKPDDRVAVIAFLRSLAPSPAPLPAPLPAAEAAAPAPAPEAAPAEQPAPEKSKT